MKCNYCIVTFHRGQLSVGSEVRIAGGSSSCGRLEVFAYGAWRVVCHDNFNDRAATVACATISSAFGYVCARAALPQETKNDGDDDDDDDDDVR